MNINLKACPFCGQAPKMDTETKSTLIKSPDTEIVDIKVLYYIKCNCGVQMTLPTINDNPLHSLEKLIDNWNERQADSI